MHLGKNSIVDGELLLLSSCLFKAMVVSYVCVALTKLPCVSHRLQTHDLAMRIKLFFIISAPLSIADFNISDFISLV